MKESGQTSEMAEERYSETKEISTDYQVFDNTENTVQRILSGITVWAEENNYSIDTEYDWMNPEDNAEFTVKDNNELIAKGSISNSADWGEPPTPDDKLTLMLEYNDIPGKEIGYLEDWFTDLT